MLKKLVATSMISGTLVLGGLAPMASAAPVFQGGLVNVNVGNVTIAEDVNVGVAAQVAANACDLIGPLALSVLGQAIAVDRTGDSRTICTTNQGPVTISQS